MKPIFIDTSYLLALLATDDASHAIASALRVSIRGPFITTECVLIELADALARTARDLATDTINTLRLDPSITVIASSTELLDAGFSLFSDRPDKSWGLTDCISFVVMQREGLTDALTADRHFEQAGFRALLRAALQ